VRWALGLEKIKKEPILLGSLVDKSGLFEETAFSCINIKFSKQ